MRFEVLDLASAFNQRAEGRGLGPLAASTPGRGLRRTACPTPIGDPRARGRSASWSSRVARETEPTRVGAAGPRPLGLARLPSGGDGARDGRPIHAGDQTHFPRESSELLGFYEIRYADDLVATHEIRFDETVGRWDAGLALPYYFARPVVAGTLPDGRDAVAVGQRVDEPAPRRPDRRR